MSIKIPGLTIGNTLNGVGATTRRAVRVATTSNATLVSAFSNGQVIDGVALVTGDRILIKNQSTASDNGIYTVQSAGAPIRTHDYGEGEEVASTLILIKEGVVNGNTAWICTNDTPNDIVGSHNLEFKLISGDVSNTTPGTSTDNTIARWDGTSGTHIQGTSLTIDDSNNIAGLQYLEFNDILSPSNPLDGQARLYKKTGDDGIWWKPDSAGVEVDLTDTGVSTIMGTTNQVSVSPTSGAVTVSTPNVFIAPGTIQDTTGMRYSTSSSVVAAGATQGTATTLTSSYNVVVTVPASSGVKLPTPPVGMRVVVVNKGVNNLNVYPDTGGAIDADGINIPLVLHIDASVTLTAASATQWYTVGPPLVAGPGTFVTYGTGRTTVTAIGGGASPLTTKGDIWGYTSGDARVPVGADGQFLAADSGTGTGLIYKNPIIVQEDGVNVASTPHTTLNFTGIVTTSDSGSGVTEINIGGSTGSRVAYVFSNIELEGSSNNYESVDYIRWDSVRNANYTNGVVLFETAITDLNLDIRVQDTTNAVTLGQMIGINTSGFHSFPIINPTTNSRMELQIRYSGAGSTFPKIFGPVIEFVNTGVLLSIVQEEYTRTEVNAASYAVTGSDQILAVLYTTTGTVAINLPQIASLPGTKKKKYTIVDEGGNATINNITINAFAGDTIIGVSNFILQSNYNSVTIYNNTVSGWFIASP